MDWKNKFEKTIGMNTAIVKAQQDNFLYSKMLADMEIKNKSLHECAYTAHAKVSEWVKAYGTYAPQEVILKEMQDLLSKMEEILNGKTDSEPTLELSDTTSRIIT